MVWNPKTWQADTLVTAADLNTELKDNLNTLKSPASAHFEANEASDYTTTNTTFVDVDGTNGKFLLTLTTLGGDVMVHFSGTVLPGSGRVFFDVWVDGSPSAGDDGIAVTSNNTVTPVSFTRLITGLSANSHTFALRWKVSAGTGTLYAGAGTATSDVHPQFWVREVS